MIWTLDKDSGEYHSLLANSDPLRGSNPSRSSKGKDGRSDIAKP